MKVRTAKDVDRGELTAKDMSVLRERDSAYVEHKLTSGILRDYSLQHRVEMQWDLNVDAQRDRIFRLKVDNLEVLLDAEEVLRMIRWV